MSEYDKLDQEIQNKIILKTDQELEKIKQKEMKPIIESLYENTKMNKNIINIIGNYVCIDDSKHSPPEEVRESLLEKFSQFDLKINEMKKYKFDTKEFIKCSEERKDLMIKIFEYLSNNLLFVYSNVKFYATLCERLEYTYNYKYPGIGEYKGMTTEEYEKYKIYFNYEG